MSGGLGKVDTPSGHHIAQLTAALHDDPRHAGPLAIRTGLLLRGDVADLLAGGLVARLDELAEDAIADLHGEIVRERRRRLHAPDRLTHPEATPEAGTQHTPTQSDRGGGVESLGGSTSIP